MTNEHDPASWLDEVRQTGGHARLLAVFGGDYMLACHRLAVMRCRASGLGDVPTAQELFAALLELHRGLGGHTMVFRPESLATVAREAGLPVI